LELFIFIQTTVSFHDFTITSQLTETGAITLDWGERWIQNHAAQCVKVNKPCLFEEYGVMAAEKCSKELGWQKVALQTKGVAGDMYWQYGDQISTGKTADDQFTVFRNSKNWDCMVVQHGKNIGVGLKEETVRARPKIRFP
jgi:mannan endo-1,4-beta-mannosidase